MIRFLLLAFVVTACAPAAPIEVEDLRPLGLSAFPEQLAFLCVSPGCDETRTVQVSVVGKRRVAVKRLLLEGAAAEDFTFTSSEPAPFVVGELSSFEVSVRYAPAGAPRIGAVDLLITYTDASPEESPDRLPAGELRIPLVRRLVGEPVLTATPEILSFGVVAPGTEATLPLTVANEGFGNVAAELASVESGHGEITVAVPENSALPPSTKLELPVTYAPQGEGFLSTTLTITPTSRDLAPLLVQVIGTSLPLPHLAIDPGTLVDFGEVARGKQRTVTTYLVNQGGQDLIISGITVVDPSGNVEVTQPNGGGELTLAPLERVALPLVLKGNVAGHVDAQVQLASNDPVSPLLQLQILGTVTEPKVTLTPAAIDFGTVPVGWVMNQPLEIRNTGYGPLTVKSIALVAGSSSLFTLGQLPALPLKLDRDQRVGLDVEFRSETAASFKGWISIETDDPNQPFAEVALTAKAGSCEEGCPISNGTPSCSGGSCSVGGCNVGWFDTDGAAANGCECKEVGIDPGQFCNDSKYMGTLKDNDKPLVTFTGVLPEDGDVDVVRFYAQDAFALFDENFDVKIRLESNDPSIQMCVYRHATGSHDPNCYWSDEVCPTNRYYRKDGANVSEDGADFIVKVFRTPGAGPTCTAYTLFMSNGR